MGGLRICASEKGISDDNVYSVVTMFYDTHEVQMMLHTSCASVDVAG